MEKTTVDFDLVFEGNSSLQAPFEDKEGALYFTSQNGNIIKVKNEEATVNPPTNIFISSFTLDRIQS